MRERQPLRVSAIPVPVSLDAADARLFRAIAELGTLSARHEAGHSDLDMTAEEILPRWRDQGDTVHVGHAALRGDDVVGILTISAPTAEGNRSLEFELILHPEHSDTEVEQALLDLLELEARRLGLPVLQTYTLHRAGQDGPTMIPRTGWGAIPRDDRLSRLMRENGFTLEQVERTSAYDLRAPEEDLRRMLSSALDAAGPDYRLVEWTSPTPAEFAESFGYAFSRMSTDVPSGDLDRLEEVWDAERVARRDARLAASGLTVAVAAVQHVPSGAIAAFNELSATGETGAVTRQWGTLVVKEHRGHRLGTVVKCANLLRWRGLRPDSPRVSTFNAEENRPMLDINEALGFVPVSYAGAWQKELTL